MKDKKSIQLLLNKEKISELSNSNKSKILGGQTAYGSPCNGGGNGGGDTATLCVYSCSCSTPGVGVC
tara:strand:- start:12763 stop:12963 length:201 start_codon:yes stop_codon:yes gene_type:complete